MEKHSHVWPCFHICFNIISHDKLTRQEKKNQQPKNLNTAESCGGKGIFSATPNVGWLSESPDKVSDLITSR